MARRGSINRGLGTLTAELWLRQRTWIPCRAHTRLRRWQWPSRDTHSRPRVRCGRGAVSPTTTPPQHTHTHAGPQACPSPAGIIHTARSAAVGKHLHVAPGKKWLQHYPWRAQAPTPTRCAFTCRDAPVDQPGPCTAPPPLEPPPPRLPAAAPSTFPPSPTHPHGTGVQQVPWLRAERTGARVGSQFSGGLTTPWRLRGGRYWRLHRSLHTGQPPCRGLGGQLHQDPGTWTECGRGALETDLGASSGREWGEDLLEVVFQSLSRV